MLNKHLIRPAATLAVAGLLAAPAFAGDTADELEDRFGGLDYEPVMDVPDRDVRTRVNKFRVETEDGRHRFGIRGRLMTDFAYVDDNYKTTDDERADRGDLAKYGTIIRRARLGALGIMYDNWEWQLEVDFRDDEIRFANAYMAYLFDSGRLAVGHFKEPFSLESSTSSRRISFIERAAPVDAYRPSRQIGIMYETLVPNWYGAFGVFGGDGVARDRDVTEGFSVAARASFAPFMDQQNRVWSHLGASANYRANAYEYERSRGRDREYESVRMRTRLGTRAVDGRLIGENDMENVEDYTTFALEAAAGFGPFSLQGEYIRQRLSRDEDSRDFVDPDTTTMTHDGYYVQASYFLTGESRNYRAFSGDFGATRILRPVSEGGRGGWELLARYATADSYEHHEPDDRQSIDHYTLGLNWYPEQDIVLKFNAMYVNAERGEDQINGDSKKWDSWVYAMRFQFEF
ncbi:phosphate-selective porin OprO/OprP [Natronocella acetinitrilica]|uniref:Phosphate-selective porin OprO/OprP n=1 Tax=Natronocella acetinitrilica TaxID=414046 RepID=A0AAE3K9U5_9GAMM|nr:porin [Natronocella acetinitrilica]MCP1673145.1 phosphate-selective porin OprO/OprP [Natronocella acetinitrilica]